MMAGILRGRIGISHLLGRLLIWRAHWGWYLFAGLTPFATLALATSISSFRNSAWTGFAPGELVLSIPLALLVALPFGPLAEELGWRGFALPILQRRFRPIVSSLILGAVWTFWHTPMFFFPGAAIPSFLDVTWYSVLLYLVQITAVSVLLTTLFNNTGGSVPLAILLHATFNAARNALFSALPEPTQDQKVEIYVLNILILLAVAIVSQRLLPGLPVRESAANECEIIVGLAAP
jgi:CAAX protease family protein